MTKACFFFFRASLKSSDPRWLTLEGFSSQDCSGGGGAWGLQRKKKQRKNISLHKLTSRTQVGSDRFKNTADTTIMEDDWS